jgi:hypothetical protein
MKAEGMDELVPAHRVSTSMGSSYFTSGSDRGTDGEENQYYNDALHTMLDNI